MPLFERGYKATTITELERNLREIEEKDKKAQTKQEFDLALQNFNSNLNFAERINLIGVKQVEILRERANVALREYERMQRMEYNEIVDDFENPRERTKRYMTMEEAQAEISKEKAERNIEFYSTPQYQKMEEKER